jgi:hypothetical protein
MERAELSCEKATFHSRADTRRKRRERERE